MSKQESISEERKPFDLNLLVDASEALTFDLKNNSLDIHIGKTSPSDFRILQNLAKGGYGEVYVVELNKTVYAMKKVSKEMVLKNTNSTFFRNEKDIMTSHSSHWLVKCHMCVQDETHIYYIMDFIPGGDMLGHLSKVDYMKESDIRFYTAEIFCALNEMHKLGWMHRDLKPDNILIDKSGHIKLADFGSCIKMIDNKVTSNIMVGTPDYISPDVISSFGDSVTYGPEVDYWTMGVIIYEICYGTTPFYSESLKMTYHKIGTMDYEFVDSKVVISHELKDLISKLLTTSDKRIGFNEIQNHPFYSDIDFSNLINMTPPFIPEMKSNNDISNFVDTQFIPDTNNKKIGFKDFVGFTHDPLYCKDLANYILRSIKETDSSVETSNKDIDMTDVNSSEIASNKSILLDSPNSESVRLYQDELSEISKELELSKIQMNETIKQIEQLQITKSEKETAMEIQNKNLSSLNFLLSEKNEILQQLTKSISEAKLELHGLKSYKTVETSNRDVTLDYLTDIKGQFNKINFIEKIDSVKKILHWFYQENSYLNQQIVAYKAAENEAKLAGMDDLKKQVRLLKSEKREYQQKLDNESQLRRKLEEEILSMKKTISHINQVVYDFSMPCINAMTNETCNLIIENNMIKIDNYIKTLNSIFIRDLRNNEMYYLIPKKRALCIQLHIFAEQIKYSESSVTRRSCKALESDLEREYQIVKGLDELLTVLTGKTKIEAEMQKKGSLTKIAHLKNEIGRARSSTLQSYEISDEDNVYEFNNHLFYDKTVPKSSLCDHCNEVIYGVVNQAYCCKDCKMVVHKSCYILVDISCELNRAIKSGTTLTLICRTKEEKDRLLKLNKAL